MAENRTIQDIIGGGQWKPLSKPELDPKRKEIVDLAELQLRDHKWKLSARKIYGGLFLFLLFLQNGAVFFLVYRAYFDEQLSNLSLVLGLVINGTLIETAFVIHTIVKWLFSDIRYKKVE